MTRTCRGTRVQPPRERVLAYMERHRGSWKYSADVAAALGMMRRIAKWALEHLWQDGILESEKQPTPKTGLGRRVFRLPPDLS